MPCWAFVYECGVLAAISAWSKCTWEALRVVLVLVLCSELLFLALELKICTAKSSQVKVYSPKYR